jgi:hypothetical protein
MTKLPNHTSAIVSEAKIVKYLLNLEHPKGKDKAKFFMQFGFSLDQWETLAQALVKHAAEHVVTNILETPEGAHFAVDGEIRTPDLRNPMIRSIWAVDTKSEAPRLITAYPLKKLKEDSA